MKRRLALPLGALVVAASFSACSAVGRSDVVAKVGAASLTAGQLAALTGDTTDAVAIREALTTWIEVVAVTNDASGIASAADLAQRKQAALEALVSDHDEAARATYELGLNGSPLLCLAAIPLDASVPAAQVLTELAAGTTFAKAAATYSADKTLADSGGIVASPEGVECIDATKFNPDLIASLTTAAAVVGAPTSVVLQQKEVVIMLRPYDELTFTNAEKLQLAANEVGAALSSRYQAAEITVSARIGKWDATQALVVAVGAG